MQLQLPLCVRVCRWGLRFATRTINRKYLFSLIYFTVDEKIKVKLCEDTFCIYGTVDMFRVLLGAVDSTQEYRDGRWWTVRDGILCSGCEYLLYGSLPVQLVRRKKTKGKYRRVPIVMIFNNIKFSMFCDSQYGFVNFVEWGWLRQIIQQLESWAQFIFTLVSRLLFSSLWHVKMLLLWFWLRIEHWGF